ncbi:hypothetical protein L9G74_21250, partial [Shewanella sp. C32]|nr:hypothetical protein [Shewanella electrica]
RATGASPLTSGLDHVKVHVSKTNTSCELSKPDADVLRPPNTTMDLPSGAIKQLCIRASQK